MSENEINKIHTTLAVISSKFDGLIDTVSKIGETIEKHEHKIVEIDKSVSSQKSWGAGVGVVVFLLLGSLVYAYQGDRKQDALALTAVAAEAEQVAKDTQRVKTDLTTYQNAQQTNWNMVINRLEAIAPAEKVKVIKAKELADDDIPAVSEPVKNAPLIKGANSNGPINETEN